MTFQARFVALLVLILCCKLSSFDFFQQFTALLITEQRFLNLYSSRPRFNSKDLVLTTPIRSHRNSNYTRQHCLIQRISKCNVVCLHRLRSPIVHEYPIVHSALLRLDQVSDPKFRFVAVVQSALKQYFYLSSFTILLSGYV